MDAWFLGFTSKLVIGTYVGFDGPKSLGKYETGAKAALPIFKKFIENVVKKKDALPFKIPKTINLAMVDLETGLQPNASTKKIIYESFKPKDHFIVNALKNHLINIDWGFMIQKIKKQFSNFTNYGRFKN